MIHRAAVPTNAMAPESRAGWYSETYGAGGSCDKGYVCARSKSSYDVPPHRRATTHHGSELLLHETRELEVVRGVGRLVVDAVDVPQKVFVPRELRHEPQVEDAPGEEETLCDEVHVTVRRGRRRRVGGRRAQRLEVVGKRAVVPLSGGDELGVCPNQVGLGLLFEERLG